MLVQSRCACARPMAAQSQVWLQTAVHAGRQAHARGGRATRTGSAAVAACSVAERSGEPAHACAAAAEAAAASQVFSSPRSSISSQPAQPALAVPLSLQGLAPTASGPEPAAFSGVSPRAAPVQRTSAAAHTCIPLVQDCRRASSGWSAEGSCPDGQLTQGWACLQAAGQPPSAVLGWLEAAVPEEARGMQPQDLGAVLPQGQGAAAQRAR